MRKTSLITIFTILVLGFLVFSVFYTRTYKQEIKVPVGVNKTVEHIINAKHLAKWYIPFASGDTLREVISSAPHQKVTLGDEFVEILESNSMHTRFIAGDKDASKELLFQVEPDNVEMNHSVVSLIYKNTLFKELFSNDRVTKNAAQSLTNFKAYLESTKMLYGYDIQKVLVKDTAFIFGSDTVLTNDKAKGMENIYAKLLDFAKQKNAIYNNVRIFHSQKLGTDQTILFAGIGIKEPIKTEASDKFQYKGMPGGKNLLVAEFNGPYSEVSKVYVSLKQYLDEHKLIAMAIPFEKFVSEGFSFADSQRVNLIVTYPIY